MNSSLDNQNHASNTPVSKAELAKVVQQFLPVHLRPTTPGMSDEAIDLERITQKLSHMFHDITDGDLIAIGEANGFWRLLHHRHDKQRIIDRVWALASYARYLCQKEACESLHSYDGLHDYWQEAAKKQTSAYHLRQLTQLLISSVRAQTINARSIYSFNRLDRPETCVWLLADGSVYSPSKRDCLTPTEVLGLSITAPDACLPDLGKNVGGPGPDLFRRMVSDQGVYRGLLDYVARAIVKPERNCLGVFVAPSDFGKTTIGQVLTEALPGIVIRKQANSLLRHGSQFSPFHTYLSKYRVVIMDDAQDKKAGLDSNKLHTATGDEVSVELKGVDSYEPKRIGAPLLFASDWPAASPTVDLANRTTYCIRVGDDVPPITKQERALLLTDDVYQTCRYLVLQHVEWLLRNPPITSYFEHTPSALKNQYQQHMAAWQIEMESDDDKLSPEARKLREMLGDWSGNKYRSSDLMEGLAERGYNLSARKFGVVMADAYPDAHRAKMGQDRAWQHP